MKYRILVICAMMLLTSCDVYKSYRSKAFVLRYDDLAAITLTKDSNCPSVCINVNNDLKQSRFWCGPFREENLYEGLCQKHGDNKYNKVVHYLIQFSEPLHNASDLLSVKIFSDRDFDAEHPAGTSLADIVRFLSCSPKEYIGSGYKIKYKYDPELLSYEFRNTWGIYYRYSNKTEFEYYPIDKMLCDVTQDDLVLLGHHEICDSSYTPVKFCSLFFEKMPVGSGEHLITVEITTDDGRVLSGEIAMDFGL